jgi:hypothetical protein
VRFNLHLAFQLLDVLEALGADPLERLRLEDLALDTALPS